MSNSSKLTIGMACFDDFDGVWFTCMSILSSISEEQRGLIDIVVVDNNPDSSHGFGVKDFCAKARITYVPYTNKKSTSIRNEVFKHGVGDWVLCLDCHVLLVRNSIDYILDFINKNDSKDLYHGVLVTETLDPLGTHLDPTWDDNFFGKWGVYKRYKELEKFEIKMHGLGMFMCKRDAWLGFSNYFRGFGGEEGYIHDKFRKNGNKVWCLSNIKWCHRFYRPNAIPYNPDIYDRIFNYFVGRVELDIACDDVYQAFSHYNENLLIQLHAQALKITGSHK